MTAIIKRIINNREALIWLTALLVLAFMDPAQQHATLCPIGLMGFDFCPGCGLGHSIAYLFRGEFMQSLHTHPLGVFAVAMLTYRIISLTYKNYKLK